MRRKNTVKIKQRATLWAIYEVTKDGMELARKEVSVYDKPNCAVRQVAVAIAKGHMVYSMGYDEYVKNAKSEFIKEENLLEN